MVCLVLILLDVIFTGVRVRMGKSKEDFANYAFSRVTVVFLMVIVWIVDQLLPTIPLLYLTSLFYSGVSVVHIIRQAREDGVEIPQSLQQRAESLEGQGNVEDVGIQDKLKQKSPAPVTGQGVSEAVPSTSTDPVAPAPQDKA